MNDYVDPRKLGFNYGKGWGSGPKPPLYYQAMKVAHRLGQEAVEASAKAWKVDHAIRAVRLAETGAEKAKAMLELSAVMETVGHGA